VAIALVVLCWFQPNLYCACAETAISGLPVNIYSNITIRFTEPRFPKNSNNLAFGRHFHVSLSHCTYQKYVIFLFPVCLT